MSTVDTTVDTEGDIVTKFEDIPTGGLRGNAITINVHRRIDRRTDGRTPERSQKSSHGLLPEELINWIRPSKIGLKQDHIDLILYRVV